MRGFYFSYSKEMPGPISTTTEELIADIHNYDSQEYEERYQKFVEKYNTIDDGKASSRVLDLLKKLMPQKQVNVYYE